jgi:peptidoglycan/LPS O-acetylase OafA/YrhL
MMIFIFHAWDIADHPSLNVQLGGIQIDLLGRIDQLCSGVDLFMVLSGFCLFWPLCKSGDAISRWEWKAYVVRRVRRIVPPYYAAIIYTVAIPVVLVALFKLVGLAANPQPLPSARQVITHLLFIHTLFPDTWAGITGAFWSLGLEAQFYAVFPLVVIGFRRMGLGIAVAMIAVSVVYRICAGWMFADNPGAHFLASIFFLGRWMEFAFGMVAALAVAYHARRGILRPAWIGSCGLIASFVLCSLAGTEKSHLFTVVFPAWELLLSLGFAVGIVALCVTSTPMRIVFENRLVASLGFISYSVFLIHQPTIWYLSEFLRKLLGVESDLLRFVILCTAGFGIVLAISSVFFVLVEKPFLNAGPRSRRAVEREGLPTLPSLQTTS